jgi:hypothetical protein
VIAQEASKEMLQSTIAPRLRALGFKGSGQVFELPDERFWALVGFQKSVSSDRSKVKFTSSGGGRTERTGHGSGAACGSWSR